MASVRGDDTAQAQERPDLEQLIYGRRKEDFTLLDDEFQGEEPMDDPFEGVAKDTGLTYEEFEYWFPDVPLLDQMRNT